MFVILPAVEGDIAVRAESILNITPTPNPQQSRVLLNDNTLVRVRMGLTELVGLLNSKESE